MKARRLLALALVTVALGTTGAAGTVAPALAADGSGAAAASAPACVSPRHDANGEGSGRMNFAANLKKAPFAHCGNVTVVHTNETIYFHCWTVNSYGNIWYWVRVKGTDDQGWMSSDNFVPDFTDDDGDGRYEEAMCPL